MSLRQLPEARVFARPHNFQPDAPSDVLARWAELPLAAESPEPDTITIFDVIGEDWWTGGGFTAKRMAAALRSIGDRPVTLQINSPGGDMFEGIAIYNLLRGHKAKVTVHVMGWAASAASVIAMAGDEIVMGLGTFMMVHKPWGGVIGTDDDFLEAHELFKQFTSALVDIYEARTGRKRAEIADIVAAETFMGPTEAVAKGFADKVDEGLIVAAKVEATDDDRSIMARRQVEAALARAGYGRDRRMEVLSELRQVAPRDASHHDAPRDASVEAAAIRQLINTLRY
jgi:ATP-dependent Clp protease protease subunit